MSDEGRLARPDELFRGAGRLTLAIWPVMVVALGLRLARLTFQPLWWDEGWSVYFATADVGTILNLTAVDIHPPFYYLLLHFWIQIFGSSVFALRLLSVVVGTAAVAVIYAAGRRLMGAMGGLIAAGLLAISPFHIYYSQEVRMYGLVTLLGLAAFYLALGEEWEVGRRLWGVWLGYVVAATAALYTQYYAAFLLVGLTLVVLIRWVRAARPVRDLLPWLAAQVVAVALFAPWLWFAGGKLAAYVRFKVGVEKDLSLGLVEYVGRQLAAFDWGHAEGLLADYWWVGLLPLVVLVPAVVLAVHGQGRFRQQRPFTAAGQTPLVLRGAGGIEERSRWPTAVLVVLLLCGFVVNLALPFNPPRSERLLLIALPAYLLAVCAALLTIWRWRAKVAGLAAGVLLAVALVSLAFFYTVDRYPGDDYRPVAARVAALGRPSDAIVCIHPWQVGYFQAYLPDEGSRPELVLTPREVLPRERQLWAEDPTLLSADLEKLLAEHSRVWLPAHQAMGRVLESKLEAALQAGTYPVLSEWYGENTVLSLFATGETRAVPVTARFGDWLSLRGAALSPGPLPAAWGIVAVDLIWELAKQPLEPYHVALRLTDSAGRVWAQRDSPPMAGLEQFSEWPVGTPQLDRHGLLVPAGTPPGEYRVTLRVYRSEDVSVVPVVFDGGSGGEVELGRVRIVRPELPPPQEALEIEQPLQVDWDERLRLLGLSMTGEAVLQPGEAVAVDLFWQALVAPGEDLLPRLQLVSADGAVVAEEAPPQKPVGGTYPTAWWQAGELVRDPHELPIPAPAQPGSYRLVLSLIRAADGLPLRTNDGRAYVDLTGIDVQGRDHRYEATTPEHPQTVRFGTSVELTGYDLQDGVYSPGSPLAVTLHWHVVDTPDRGYHSFVHLLAADGTIVAQHDGPPAAGELPALGWLPGETLTDTHLLSLPSGLPSGEYRLGVGLYDPLTTRRLGDRALLQTVVSVKADE